MRLLSVTVSDFGIAPGSFFVDGAERFHRGLHNGLSAFGGGDRVAVGHRFAAETEDVEAHALAKLGRKDVDLIAANSVAGPQGAFGSDQNRLVLLGRDGFRAVLGPAAKTAVLMGMSELCTVDVCVVASPEELSAVAEEKTILVSRTPPGWRSRIAQALRAVL